MRKHAIIIGAGPAGLTAAYELLKRTDIVPIVLEKSEYIGGISRTIDYKGNRMDMGPHRFFSKSDRVMDWWLHMFPLEDANGKTTIAYQNKTREISADKGSASPTTHTDKDPDKVMLLIQRLTRIYFLRKFFAYPIQLGLDTLRTLGLIRTIRIMFSFLLIRLFPRKPEKSLEDFIINKFGKELYLLFFKDYTEKVWGVPCNEISAEWGAQRIKGVSLSKAVIQALKTLRDSKKKKGKDLSQKSTETSLIEQFLYPKKGPGALWEEVARQVVEMGGQVVLHQDVRTIYTVNNEICSIHAVNSETGELTLYRGDYFFSTMPVKELIAAIDSPVPTEVKAVAAGLMYRDFINVGILLKRLSAPNKEGVYEKLELKDNWIYIQERDVKVGRLMIYNNWGSGMIKDPNTTWIGMEYFCNKTDAFWDLSDEEVQAIAVEELLKMDLAAKEDILDMTVRRMEKTYPAYFGTYDEFDKIRAFTDTFGNLFLVGRNGMHKYNNADHSMLTAMVAVDNIAAGIVTKDNLWAINTEQEYHEEKSQEEVSTPQPAQQRKAPRPEPSFPDFVWRNKWNRAFVIFAALAFLAQYVIFKFRYPFANYMPDSYSYLEAAYTNADVNMWPVAYSKFLRLLSVFFHSDKIVVGIQYFMMQASSLLFLSTLLYFFKPGKGVRVTLQIFFLFNPLPLFVANYIAADALFISLSLCWLTVLLWILYRPRPWQLWVQAILLLACFTVRYNAIYYPLIGALAFILSRQSWKPKLAGIALGCLLVFGSVWYTSLQMKEQTGQRQFSAFGGWQLANNALYMYQHIPAKDRDQHVPARFVKLEAMVRQHMDTLSKVKFSHEDSLTDYFYLWSGRGPLIHYLEDQYKKDSTTPYFKRWATEGPLYADYASYLIRRYPAAYAETWMFPNAVKWAVPPTEFLGTYNMGGDSVGQLAKAWFNYKSRKVSEHNSNKKPILATEWYPIFAAMVNVLLVLMLIGLFMYNGFRDRKSRLPRLTILVVAIWLVNMGFSVFASPIVLRYQVFPIAITFCLALLAGETVYKLLIEDERKGKAAKDAAAAAAATPSPAVA